MRNRRRGVLGKRGERLRVVDPLFVLLRERRTRDACGNCGALADGGRWTPTLDTKRKWSLEIAAPSLCGSSGASASAAGRAACAVPALNFKLTPMLLRSFIGFRHAVLIQPSINSSDSSEIRLIEPKE